MNQKLLEVLDLNHVCLTTQTVKNLGNQVVSVRSTARGETAEESRGECTRMCFRGREKGSTWAIRALHLESRSMQLV